jgi:pimeloyl-ACP methyl ester carboxylesterase
MPADTVLANPIVFIHGLWLHAESWDPWIVFFSERGYEASAANWPGDAATTEATRRNPDAVAGFGVGEIADYIAGQIKRLARKPILIGHSFGGLLAQHLLGHDLAVAAIAIDPAPIKGVYELPLSALKATLPVLINPFNFKRAVSLTQSQFRFAFANAVSDEEAQRLYARYAMPAPARPLFQAATAMLNPNAATKVNAANTTRGPLLLMAGSLDNTVPPVLVHSAKRLYASSSAVTELKEFAGRGHSLVIDSGWREIAEYCGEWLRTHKL